MNPGPRLVIALALAVMAVIAAGGVAFLLLSGDDDGTGGPAASVTPTLTSIPSTAATSVPTRETEATMSPVPSEDTPTPAPTDTPVPFAATPLPSPTPVPTVASSPTAAPSPSGFTGFPPLPTIYTGMVTVGGVAAPDGVTIVARVGDYSSAPVEVLDGLYRGLVVGPPHFSYVDQEVTFYLGALQADETDVFTSSGFPTLKADFALTFPSSR